MFSQTFTTIVAVAASQALAHLAAAQVISTVVDILSPGDEGYDGIPPNLLVIDIFVDIAVTDVWTASGIRLLVQNGASIVYFDGEPNTPGLQPGLINPGLENRFLTSLSQPRARNGNGRFRNAGAMVAGSYDGGAVATTTAGELNVAYFAAPPMTSGSPSVDGWIARIAVNLSQTVYTPDELIIAYTPQARALLACVPIGAPWGLASATFDVPSLQGLNFWVIPEPATILLVAAVAFAARRVLRGNSARGVSYD